MHRRCYICDTDVTPQRKCWNRFDTCMYGHDCVCDDP
jgi:hypothetical protein